MFFKNLMLYRLPQGWSMSAAELDAKLAQRPLQPCTGLAAQSFGWVTPTGDDRLAYGMGQHLLLALGREVKVLPASVVRDAVQQKAADIEARMGFKPGKKQVREIKESAVAELLPKAFARRSITRAWIDAQAGWLVLEASSYKRGDELTAFLSETLGEFAVEPPDVAAKPAVTMTAWLGTNCAPPDFTFDDAVTLVGNNQEKPTVRYQRHPLENQAALKRHLEEGKSVSAIALIWLERVSMVVTDTLMIKRVRFRGVHDGDDVSSQSKEEKFDADFALMTGELQRMLTSLGVAMGVSYG